MPEPSPDATRARTPGLRRAGLELVVLSFLVLFQELALIRWLPSQVRAVAYFPNLVLIAAFLGLGVGCLRARRRPMLWLWPVALLACVVCAAAMSRVVFTAEGTSEYLWLLYNDLPDDARVVPSVRIPLVLVFLLSGATFVPLGQAVAERLNVFREHALSLRGYALDLSGSLVGVVGFAAVSFMHTFPTTWFAMVALVGILLVVSWPRRNVLVYSVSMVLVLVAVVGFERAEWYSPYYALTRAPAPGGSFVVRTNGSFHQVAIGMADTSGAGWPGAADTRPGYRLPYQMLDRPPGRVLVLGAGTGNDISVALRAGAREVHAVEIDPIILEIGRDHPDHPYADPRVRIFNTDARTYLNDATQTYDLVVFGTLDSQTRLSALSSVRLDNFVYTREGLAAAARLLEPDGGMVLYFGVQEDYIWQHLVVMLTAVFDEVPATLTGEWNLFNSIFLAGPAFAGADRELQVTSSMREGLARMPMPTDDWPYLYLPEPGIGTFYLSLIGIFLVLAIGAVALASPEWRRDLSGGGADWEMFLFGMAFLLLETRFITDMNLLWGATWLTSAVVFGSILATILLTTILMELRPLPWVLVSSGLAVSLLVVWLIPTDALLAREPGTRLGLSLLYVGAPVLFAAACFAARFRERTAVDLAFGWNLLGAVTGGLVEFFSMSLGLDALLLVALVAYMAAFLIKERGRQIQGSSGLEAPAPVGLA